MRAAEAAGGLRRARLRAGVAGAYLLGVLGAAVAQPPTESQRILECVVDNLPDAARLESVSVSTAALGDAEGTAREIELDIAVRSHEGNLQARALVRAPEDLRGTAYLYRARRDGGADIYHHAPDLGRTRRIAGADSAGTVFDTAVTFSDLTEGMRTLRSSSVSLRPQRAGDPENVREFVVLPPPGTDLQLSRIELRVRTDACAVVGARVYGAGRELLREATVPPDALRRDADGHWYPARVRVANPEIELVSEITVGRFAVDTGLSGRWFDPESFHHME